MPPKPFEVTIKPRVYETDLLGHINNVSLSGWVETGRVRFLEAVDRDNSPSSSGSWVVVSITQDFVAETQYGRTATLTVTDVVFGTTSMTIHSEIHQAGVLTVRSKSVMVHLALDTKEKAPIPDSLKQEVGRLLGTR